MTIKLLMPAKDPNPTYRSSCHCGAYVEFQKSDAREEVDRNEMFLVIACPECKRDMWTDPKAALPWCRKAWDAAREKRGAVRGE